MCCSGQADGMKIKESAIIYKKRSFLLNLDLVLISLDIKGASLLGIFDFLVCFQKTNSCIEIAGDFVLLRVKNFHIILYST